MANWLNVADKGTGAPIRYGDKLKYVGYGMKFNYELPLEISLVFRRTDILYVFKEDVTWGLNEKRLFVCQFERMNYQRFCLTTARSIHTYGAKVERDQAIVYGTHATGPSKSIIYPLKDPLMYKAKKK